MLQKKLSPEDYAQVKAVFMSEFDANNDGKISLDEVLYHFSAKGFWNFW